VTDDLALRYWHAVADLPHDRSRALAELASIFRAGTQPQPLEGPHEGRLLTTTFGYGLDAITMGLSRAWMPWKGKTFDPEAKEGRNLFSPEFRWAMRVLWPSYDDVRDEGPRLSTFRFTSRTGPGALEPGVAVSKIDYDHEGSPSFLIRPILDEIVAIDAGLYLGQALMRIGGDYRRVAWFSLATP
jgi:hypothetical protein